MKPLDLLVATAPDWFVLRDAGPARLRGEARHGPWTEPGIDLTIRAAPCPVVGETVPGTRLPSFCPDRHVQGDRTFCVGLGRPAVDSLKQAGNWWSDLDQYLGCQAVAEATRIWPPMNALDHGPAGYYHQRALRLAGKLGVMDAYLEAYFDQPSWITGRGLATLEGKRDPARPGPSAGNRRPKIRGGRKARLRLLELVMLERRRRSELARYHALIEGGTQMCCGAMRDCRFPKRPA